ncbi:17572_t:CDS:2, partial [Acaulospora colombiana]
MEHLIVNETAWLLKDRIEVVSAETFLKSNFQSKSMDASRKTMEEKVSHFHNLSFRSHDLKEKEMYQPLGVHSPHCFRIDSSRFSVEATTGIHTKMAPDLFITNSYQRSIGHNPTLNKDAPFLCDGLCVEVKAQDSWDPNLIWTEASGKTQFQSPLTKNQ